MEKEFKINQAREQAEIQLQEQKELLMRREEAAEKKRQQFEAIREKNLIVTKQKAQKKAQD